MRSRSCSLAAAVCAALLLAPAARAATVRGPADVAALTAAADAVLRARVTAVTSGWAGGDPASGVIVTAVVLEPLEWWKGSAPGGGIGLQVNVPGGAVGEWSQTVQGAAAFHAGEEVVVFLSRRRAPAAGGPALFEVERWALGKFGVGAATPGGRVRAARDRTGLSCVGCGEGEQDDLPLDELRGRVLEAAQRSPAQRSVK